MPEFDNHKLSIVIQGKVDNTQHNNGKSITQLSIDSCRKFFPSAEIILSTWSGDNFDLENFDKLVLSEDPGDPTPTGIKAANTGRQIISSRAGLEAATREFAIKTRTDLIFTHGEIFNYFSKYPFRNKEYLITKNRVILSNISSYKPNKRVSIPFHFSDFIYAGNRSDLISIFEAPIPNREDYLWFEDKKRPKMLKYFPNWTSRFSPESWLIINLVKKRFQIDIKNSFDIENNAKLLDLSKNILISNFIVLNTKQLGIKSLKNNLPLPYFCFCYLHKDWLNLYNKQSGEKKYYFDKEIFIKWLFLVRLNLKIFLMRFLKFFIIKSNDRA